jgi:hypothetical protein
MHKQQHATATSNQELCCSAEESLAHRVCLLLIELHLCTHQPARALNLITYIETQFVCTDSVISADKDMKPLEKEHREKKVPTYAILYYVSVPVLFSRLEHPILLRFISGNTK